MCMRSISWQSVGALGRLDSKEMPISRHDRFNDHVTHVGFSRLGRTVIASKNDLT